MQIAETGLEELRAEVDALIVIPNDRLLGIIQKEVTAVSAFAMSDEILRQAVEGISDLIITPGIINVDFADARAIMSNAGSALIGIGRASGEKRAEEAARAAINSPLLDISINGARGVLFAIAGGPDLTMHEITEAAKIITETVDKEAKIIVGAINDPKLGKGELVVTVIACGFPENAHGKPLFSNGQMKTKVTLQGTKDEVLGALGKQGATNGNGNGTPLSSDDNDDWNAAVPAFLRRKDKK